MELAPNRVLNMDVDDILKHHVTQLVPFFLSGSTDPGGPFFPPMFQRGPGWSFHSLIVATASALFC